MNQFVEAMKIEENKTFTENGAPAIKSTGDACLNLFAVIGALRQTVSSNTTFDIPRAQILFDEAYKEDPLLATKTLFYARDIREGLGEREVVRKLMAYVAKKYPNTMRDNLDLIGIYGRYDDMYTFIGTPLEDEMWKAMSKQFEEDRKNLSEGKAISLLAKWIKTPDASSKKTRALGILTAKRLGYSVYNFKRILRAMRKQIDIVERHMSAGEWNQIKYPTVSSRAMMIYREAFQRHDYSRYNDYIQAALDGKAKINSGTLYPYDIVEKFLYKNLRDNDTLEALWSQLPDYVGGDNILVMADVSGSMEGRPMASSVGLAMYFAERNKGEFKNMFMTFSSEPEFIKLEGGSFRNRLKSVYSSNWGYSTNFNKAFEKILTMCKENEVPAEDMPKALVVISDMEIDACSNRKSWVFYEDMERRFAEEGYKIPNIVFWNVASRHDTFLADKSRKGVQLVSGHSTSTFKALIKCLGMDPKEFMLEVLNSERYSQIKVA